jgi:methionine-rich copper-binding protein CopC
MKTIRKTLLIASFVLASVVAADAHAQLDRSDPRVGSTVSRAPPALTLYFSEAIEPAFSSVQVTDGAGRRVDSGKLRVGGADRRQMQLPLKPLPAGSYTVRWRALSVDTHTTEGSFSFEVRP